MKFGPNLHRPPDDQVPRERLPELVGTTERGREKVFVRSKSK